MLNVKSSITIDAPSPLVMSLYLDYANWHKLFPLTIRGVRYIKEENGSTTVEVDHRKEGFVINILSRLSNEEIRLEEFKPKYNAIFMNRFQRIATGTLYTVVANVTLKGMYKIAAPFVKSLVKSRVMRFVLEPMKKFSENAHAN